MNADKVNDPKIIVAVDVPTRKDAFSLGRKLDPRVCRVKIGKELFTAAGPAVVEDFMKRGFGIFLDLKYHDTPSTVAGAIRSSCGLGVWMVNMHCLGGRKMMEAAVKAAQGSRNPPKLIGVTVLTSMDEDDLAEVGIGNGSIPVFDEVRRLARLASDCGLDGVVSSAKEASRLRLEFGRGFDLVTPGIREEGAPPDDQARTMTARQAIEAGASYLVIGRPVTMAKDLIGALRGFNQEISSAQEKLK